MSDMPPVSLEELRTLLGRYGQDHLLAWWDQLDGDRREELRRDILEVDLDEMREMWDKTGGDKGKEMDKLCMEPVEAELCESALTCGQDKLIHYQETALRAASAGQVGVLLLAGGQGTRLGVPYPKGMYDIGLLSSKTLYQIQVERILRLQELAKRLTGVSTTITMYIMTSECTKEATADFFTKHDYFGMRRDQVVIFEQRVIPAFDMEGKFILEHKSKLVRAPDGNGGLYWALQHEGVLEHMEAHDVRYLHVYCVDNVLVKVADPHFMGYCIDKKAESGNKVVEKEQPSESVGVVCRIGGKIQVVEYSEISPEDAERREETGRLTYHAGNICNHFFTREFLTKVCRNHLKDLPHHIAKKKIPHIDDNGELVRPEKPNGIKLEKFVFDVFQFSDKFVVWTCERDDEFSPLKNADGAAKDTPTTSRMSLYNLHRRYIESAGCSLTGDGDDSCVSVEISPLVSYAGEGLEHLRKKNISAPIHISEEMNMQNGV